tara:strand:+ start:71 stop:523 length:453 start_codon:yes stop_codon:yes gene_type:complete
MKIFIFFELIKVFLVTLLLSSCATVNQTEMQKITIRSTPSNASVFTSHGYGCNLTPCQIRVPRSKSFKLFVTKPGYTTENILIKNQISNIGLTQGVGSLALAGLPGIGYDIYKGSLLELSPSEVNISLKNMSTMLINEIRTISDLDILIE